MNVRMRYVIKKQNKDGSCRWYWQRRGHKSVPLMGDDVERFAQAARLNGQADGQRQTEQDFGTVSWAASRYMGSDRYTRLAPSSREAYQRWIKETVEMWGHIPCSAITLDVLEKFFASPLFEGRSSSSKEHAKAALVGVLNVAKRHKLIADNPGTAVEILGRNSRDEYWLPNDERAFLDSCAHDPRMALAFRLLLFTAQRPIDVMQMTWGQLRDSRIHVRQQKTRRLVDIPIHRDLQTALDTTPRKSTLIVPFAGATPKKRYRQFYDQFKRYCGGCGLGHLQARDLRRTAVVRLAEAGCTVFEVASITGHKISQCQTIIDTYWTRTPEMSRSAILKWEQKSDAS